MNNNFKLKFKPGDVVLYRGYRDKCTISSVDNINEWYDIVEDSNRCIMFEYQDEWLKFARKGQWYICEKEIGEAYEGMIVKYMGDNVIQDLRHIDYDITEQELAENFRIWNPYDDIQPGDIVWSPKGAGVEIISIVRKFCTVEREKNTLCSEITLRVEDDELVCGGLGIIWQPSYVDPILPASESQKKHLLDKMAKEGYSYDFKKHKLKKPVRHRPKIDIAEKYADEAVKRADKSLYDSGYSRHTIMGITLFSGADIEEAVDYGREEEHKRIMKKLRSWIKGHADSKLVDLLTGFVDDIKQDK